MPPPVHLVTGDDDHLVHRALERLLADLRRDLPDVDIEQIDAGEAAHLPELRTASLFGGTRCVVVRGAEGLSGDLAREIDEYLDAPEPDALLVLVARGTGRIRSLATKAAEVGEKTDVSLPKPWDDRGWQAIVRDELAVHDRQADAAAVAALFEHAGTDPSTISSKCAQVAAAVPSGQRITVEDVERIVEGHGNRGGFPIADAVADRDPVAALVTLRGALEAGEAPLALLGAITYRFRQLLQVRGGASPKDAGMSTGQFRRLQGIASRNFTPGELAWCHDRIARADLDLKGSDLPSDLIIELAVIDLATEREVGRPWNPLATS